MRGVGVKLWLLRNKLQKLKGRLDSNLNLSLGMRSATVELHLLSLVKYIAGFMCKFYFVSVYVPIDAIVLCLGKGHRRQSAVCLINERGHSSHEVTMSGLVINPVCSWLGASPDGVIHDPGCSDPNGLLEIKCPYNYYDSTHPFSSSIQEAVLLSVGKG